MSKRLVTEHTESLDSVFIDRFSTRSFSYRPVSDTQLSTLFEAARWAPSASNSQPWLFLYSTTGTEREVFNSLLRPNNQRWATAAPVLAYVFARKYADDGRAYRTSQFDTGAAWMSLAIQAAKLGLHTHAIGGINFDQVHDKLGLSPDDYDVIVGVAIGYRGNPANLPDDLQLREHPSDRKQVTEIARRWVFPS